MLKKLLKGNVVNINDILLTNYKELKLTETELVILMHLFKMLNQKQTLLSLNTLAKRCFIDIKEIGDTINALMKKGFLSIEIEYSKDLKEKEIFNLDSTIEKIEMLFFEENNKENKRKDENEVAMIIKMIESEFGKILSSSELDIILTWVNDRLSVEEIKQAVLAAKKGNKCSLRYVDSILVANRKNQIKNIEEQIVVDEKTKKTIDDFYKLIK